MNKIGTCKFSTLACAMGILTVGAGCGVESSDAGDSGNNATVEQAMSSSLDPASQVDLVKYNSGFGQFSALIRVANIAYSKQVAVAGTTGNGVWLDYPAVFRMSLPDGTELWEANDAVLLTRFAIRYTVNGSTYWDNNGGQDYLARSGTDTFIGRNVAIWPVAARCGSNGTAVVTMGIRNLAYEKVVGARYTLDSWAHWTDANGSYAAGSYTGSHQGEQESWEVTVPLYMPFGNIAAGGSATLAGYYRLPSLGQEHWANLGGENFTVQCRQPANWMGCYCNI